MKKHEISNSRVLESREVSNGLIIRRRRESPDGYRFTTYERIERPSLIVRKKSGEKELFDRDKLSRAIKLSVGKFFPSEIEIEETISKIEDAIYELNKSEITSRQIGDIVLKELKKCNEVAYVRFASVYNEFKSLKEFRNILDQADENRDEN